MRFDFYLPEYNIVIECDGAQHFRSINSEWNSKTKLQETRARDKAKQQYCEEHGITLLQIPFWDHTALSKENLKKVISECRN
jgi:very-short-patch-repair endonuclease